MTSPSFTTWSARRASTAGHLLQATGFQTPGFPGMGCWVSYGLGSMNDNLPTFVVLPDHRGFASNGPKNWDSAFLPAAAPGDGRSTPAPPSPVADLCPAVARRLHRRPRRRRPGGRLLGDLNRRHAAERPGDARLDARIKQLRTGGPDATGRPRGPRPVGRAGPRS